MILETALVYIILISQIILLSYYYPTQIIKRFNYIFDNYLPTDYPKLYPEEYNLEKAKKGVKTYTLITRSTLAIGALLLILATYDGMIVRGEIKDGMVTVFAVIQIIPFLLLEVSELKYYKMLRAENDTPKRSASLSPRRYFDYVSPIKFGTAFFFVIAYVYFNLFRNEFEFHYSNDGFISLATITLVHIYFTITVLWAMYGKKLNPHQSRADRDRLIGSIIHTTLNISIAATIFMLVYGILQHYDNNLYEAMALSIYFQCCLHFGLGTMLKKQKIEDIDFSTYTS